MLDVNKLCKSILFLISGVAVPYSRFFYIPKLTMYHVLHVVFGSHRVALGVHSVNQVQLARKDFPHRYRT